MGAKKQREYQCSVVDETVKIHLRKKAKAGWTSSSELIVQCDQGECQYVDDNEPPCPLTLLLFEEEIHDRDEKARLQREEREESSDYY
ncbi:MAG: hypothetical protein ABI333_26950 [bacterium]